MERKQAFRERLEHGFYISISGNRRVRVSGGNPATQIGVAGLVVFSAQVCFSCQTVFSTLGVESDSYR